MVNVDDPLAVGGGAPGFGIGGEGDGGVVPGVREEAGLELGPPDPQKAAFAGDFGWSVGGVGDTLASQPLSSREGQAKERGGVVSSSFFTNLVPVDPGAGEILEEEEKLPKTR